ncbi:MAG: type II toxin-antitoxin system PemK/MazF family toxin [Actinobacteria bacterium]|nr:type II toxin-antitoxin system PemK/MazF family toxin [Actinomycetota bacterium]
MAPKRGAIYALAMDGNGDPEFVAPAAERALIVSEDPWNETMQASVVVPIYRREGEISEHAALLQPSLDDAHYADCTLVLSLDHDDLGHFVDQASGEALAAVVGGLRAYLDIDDLMAKRIKRPPSVGRATFWPRQRDIYWGRRFGEQRERYLIVADDEFNVRAEQTAAMFLTSRDKTWRSRWQVPGGGGFVITGDIDQFDYNEFDDRARPDPKEFSRDEMAEVAAAIVDVLEL